MLGNQLGQLIQNLQPGIDATDQLSIVESLLTSSAGAADTSELLADVLSTLLVPPENQELVHSFTKEEEESQTQWDVSSVCADLSDAAVSKLISLTCAESSQKLDLVTYSVLYCKFQQEHLKAISPLTAKRESLVTSAFISDKDRLLSTVFQITRSLLSTDSKSPSKNKCGKDLASGASSQHGSTDFVAKQAYAAECVNNLKKSCQSNLHASKLVDLSLLSRQCDGHFDITSPVTGCSKLACVVGSEEEGKKLLDHAVSSLFPASVKIAGLLLQRSLVLLEHFLSHGVSKLSEVSLCDLELCSSNEDNRELLKIHSYFYLLTQCFKSLSGIDSNGEYTFNS